MKNASRSELKVGLFVLIGLVLIAVLMVSFSKGLTLFDRTYEVNVIMPTVSGLKPKAAVMISGVPVGTILTTELSPSGTNVIIRAKLLSKYKIHKDAEFHIDALGFLGDQYLAITPKKNEGPLLKRGDEVHGQAPFNLQEAVRSTSGLLDQARSTMQNLDQAITNINRTILSQQTLLNFGRAMSNLQTVTEVAMRTSVSLENLVNSNTLPLTVTVTNLQAVSEKLNLMADALEKTVSTNGPAVTAAVNNFRDTAANFKQISDDLQAGKGLAGSLLKDEELKAQTAALVTNANALAVNLRQFSSDLNTRGLWSMLWKQKHPETGKR